jgi:hypothetical protein
MTNEEIESEIARLIPTLSPFLDERASLLPVKTLMGTFAHLIALKAYEEAAQVLDKKCVVLFDFDGKPMADAPLHACSVCLYCTWSAEVRALQSSLVAESVAST